LDREKIGEFNQHLAMTSSNQQTANTNKSVKIYPVEIAIKDQKLAEIVRKLVQEQLGQYVKK